MARVLCWLAGRLYRLADRAFRSGEIGRPSGLVLNLAADLCWLAGRDRAGLVAVLCVFRRMAGWAAEELDGGPDTPDGWMAELQDRSADLLCAACDPGHPASGYRGYRCDRWPDCDCRTDLWAGL